MDKRIIIAIALILFSITAIFLMNRYGTYKVMLIPLGLMGISSVFFSRGILIFLTALCLMFSRVSFPGLWFIEYLRWVFFALLGLHVFGDIFLGRTVRSIKSFDILAMIFIIFAFLSTFYSPYPNLTIERATTILFLYISIFWIIWKYAYDQGAKRVIYLLLQVIKLILILSYAMIFISPHRAFLLGRFRGILGNPNAMWIICSLFLPIAFGQFLETRKNSALFLAFIILVSLLISGSRNSLIAMVVSMGYFIYGRTKEYRPLVFFSLLSFVSIFTWVFLTSAKQFFTTYLRVESIPMGAGRFEVWPMAIDLISKKPILGSGFGIEDRIFEVTIKHITLKYQPGGVFHNSYLGMAVQLGITGLIIFFLPLVVLLFKELSLKQDTEVPLLRYALRASLLAGLMSALFESWIYAVGNSFSFPFWTLVMLLVFHRYQDKGKIMPEGT